MRRAFFRVADAGADGSQRYAVLLGERKSSMSSVIIAEGSRVTLLLEESGSEFFKAGREFAIDFTPLDAESTLDQETPGEAHAGGNGHEFDHRPAEGQAERAAAGDFSARPPSTAAQGELTDAEMSAAAGRPNAE